jgi:hypothetical protein
MIAPFPIKTLHAHDLLKKRPQKFITGLLKIYFSDKPVNFLPMKFMNSFMQNKNPFENNSPGNETGKSWYEH